MHFVVSSYPMSKTKRAPLEQHFPKLKVSSKVSRSVTLILNLHVVSVKQVALTRNLFHTN